MSRIWLISDLQVPYHDQRAVNAVSECINDLKSPDDIVVTVGDEIDLPQIGRWTQGKGGEWERTLGRDRDMTVQILADLRVDHVIRSNHTDRLFNSLESRLPGLLGLPELTLPNFLRLPELGIEYHEEAFNVAPGWVVMHGDEAGVSQVPGQTAFGLTQKVGLSVACGHTHRLGLRPQTQSVNGRVTRILYGMEVGCLMDFKQAKYTKTHNWQQGFGILYVDGKKVSPSPIPIENKSFVVEGHRYSW
jgi:hypothetical protein